MKTLILILFVILLVIVFIIGYVDEIQRDTWQDEMDEFERHMRNQK